MTDEEIVDAEVVPDGPGAEPGPSTALARRERRSEVIRPLDQAALVESFAQYQELLPKLLDANDYQDAGRGKRFVKKSGWRKIATAFDLDVIRVHDTVERDEHGQPVRAMAVYRAIAPSGRSMDGDGYCDVAEERFSGPRGNKSKLENDLRATATTRAKNRAIADLVGMGEVSAEEISAGEDACAAAAALEASPELRDLARRALGYLLDGDDESVTATWTQLAEQYGGAPPAVALQAVVITAKAIKDHHAKAAA